MRGGRGFDFLALTFSMFPTSIFFCLISSFGFSIFDAKFPIFPLSQGVLVAWMEGTYISSSERLSSDG